VVQKKRVGINKVNKIEKQKKMCKKGIDIWEKVKKK